MIPIIIDTDPGIDDAAALTIAMNNPMLDLRLITTVAGNVNVEQTTTNALKLVQFSGKEIPVAKGATRPLLKEFEDASYAHGETGMAGYDFAPLTREPIQLQAVEAIRQELLKTKEPITLITIGSLTNIALLIREYPEVLSNIKEVIIMGGSLSGGNITGSAEFNIYADPHAAKIVFESGLNLTMIGLDVTMQTLLTPESLFKLQNMNEAGKMLYQLFANYNSSGLGGGLTMHDVCTIYYLLHRDREDIQTKDYYVEIQTDGPAAGTTVADIRAAYHNGQTNCTVGLKFNSNHFNQWFLEQVSAIK